MKQRILIQCCLLLVMATTTRCKNPSTDKDTIKSDTANVTDKLPPEINVSIIRLIATPDKYDQKVIRIKGYLNLEFEGNAIYLSKESYDLGIDKNGVWLDLDNTSLNSKDYKRYSKQHVILEGTFQMNNTGHQNSFSGAITKITRIDPLMVSR